MASPKPYSVEEFLGTTNYSGASFSPDNRKVLVSSDFSLGLHGQRWLYAMELWSEWVFRLMALKPHKRLYFERGCLSLYLL